MSSMRPAAAALSEMRPSCGLRRSAMSSFASTFRRVVTPGASRLGIRCISCSTPSIRKRTTSASSCGSKWTSLAPSSAAWKMIELTRRTSGASEMPSSTSRSSFLSSAIPVVVELLEHRAGAEGLRGASEPADLGDDVVAGRRPRARRDSGSRAGARRSRARSAGRRWRPAASPSSSAYGIAATRSSTCSGISSPPPRRRRSSARSTSGSW